MECANELGCFEGIGMGSYQTGSDLGAWVGNHLLGVDSIEP